MQLGRDLLSTREIEYVTDHEWDMTAHWSLHAFTGTRRSSDEELVLAGHRTKASATTPHAHELPPGVRNGSDVLKVDVTWLLRHLQPIADATTTAAPSLLASFSIERTHPRCFTPRRNPDVDAALAFMSSMQQWGLSASSLITDMLRWFI